MNGIVRFLAGIGLAAAAGLFFVLTSVAGLFVVGLVALAFLLNIGGIRSRLRAMKEDGTWVVTSFGRGDDCENARIAQEDAFYAQEDGTRRNAEDSGPCVDLEASEYRRVRREEGDQSS
ncbi:MAG: hypothetical protein IKX79_05335 [Desulfovibrionaceae bacterium]|nr:hypothetical protein [Desulfovibrionaceae bacterium]MBR5734939.1 hypothetical protein [Desulfovibrionaceae bacterium]